MLKFPVSLLTRTNVGEFLDKIVFRINYKWEEVICILLFIRCGRVKFSFGVPCRGRSFLRCRLSWRCGRWWRCHFVSLMIECEGKRTQRMQQVRTPAYCWPNNLPKQLVIWRLAGFSTHCRTIVLSSCGC